MVNWKVIAIIVSIALIVSIILNVSYSHFWQKENTRAEYYKEQTITMHKIAELNNEVANECLVKVGVEPSSPVIPLEQIIVD